MNEFITKDNKWHVLNKVYAVQDHNSAPWGTEEADGVDMPAFQTQEEIQATWLEQGSWPSVQDVQGVLYFTRAKWGRDVTLINGGFAALVSGTVMGVKLI